MMTESSLLCKLLLTNEGLARLTLWSFCAAYIPCLLSPRWLENPGVAERRMSLCSLARSRRYSRIFVDMGVRKDDGAPNSSCSMPWS